MVNFQFREQHPDIEYVYPEFKCNELPLVSGLCIFHDVGYHQRHPDDINKRLKRKMEMLSGTRLDLIQLDGLRLASLSLLMKLDFLLLHIDAESLPLYRLLLAVTITLLVTGLL